MKISELTKAAEITGEELLPVVQNGETKKVSRDDFVGTVPDGIRIENGTVTLLSNGETVGESASLPEITVDGTLSTTSKNAVQNKAVTEALNGKLSDENGGVTEEKLSEEVKIKLNKPQITVDTELSSESENPISNSAVAKGIENLKDYIDRITHLECLAMTNDTAKKVDAGGIVGGATYMSSEKTLTVQIYALIKEKTEEWKIEPLGEDENGQYDIECEDFKVCGNFSGEYIEMTKAELDALIEAPAHTGQYSETFRWCGVKWLYGQGFFGYSNMWDFTSLLESFETEAERQAFLDEMQQSAQSLNDELSNAEYISVSVTRKKENLPVIEREVV